MTEAEIIEKLKKVDGAFAAYHVISRFIFLRNAKDGHIQEVSVEILDAGPDANPSMRFHCRVRDDDGRTAAGNPDSSIEYALMHMHWEQLDWSV